MPLAYTMIPLAQPNLTVLPTIIATFNTGDINKYSGAVVVNNQGHMSALFTVIGGATATNITLYGTIDPAAATQNGNQLVVATNYPAPGAANGYWFQLEAPPMIATTGSNVYNPITAADSSQYLPYLGAPWMAVCAVSGATQTGTSQVLCFAG